MLPNQVFGAWQSSPIVVDGIMYLTMRPNDIVAVDAKNCRVFWQYRYNNSPDQRVCCGSNNRGVAILGDTLFMGTLDAHLVAVDAKNGRQLWNQGRRSEARLLDHAGAAGRQGQGDHRRRRRRVRDPRLHRRPRRRRPARSCGGSTRSRARASRGSRPGPATHWKTGGGSVWVTGSYDPALNLTYWGVGNPGSRLDADQRPGDNLYTDSVVALDADTGAIKWHLPVHAERRLRLRLGAGAGARRYRRQRHADEGDAVGESQRQLLCARSRDRASSCSASRS